MKSAATNEIIIDNQKNIIKKLLWNKNKFVRYSTYIGCQY